MNRTYRLVWNRALRVLQVASELAGCNRASVNRTVGGGARPAMPTALAIGVALALGTIASPASASPAEVTITHGDASTTTTTASGTNPVSNSGPGTLTDGTLNTQLGVSDVVVTTSTDGITSNNDAIVHLNANTLTLDSKTYINLGGTYAGPGSLNLLFKTTLDLAASAPIFTGAAMVTATGDGTSTIKASGQTWNLTGSKQGSLATLGIGFSGVANLSDSTAGNFVFADGANVGGTVNGGGAGTLDYSAYTTSVNVDLGGSATGTGGWSGISTAKGGSAADTISGSNQTYGLTGANAGGNGTVSWDGFGNINDATGTVNFGTAGSVSGNIAARSLNYAGYSVPVSFDLSNGSGATTGVGGTWSGVATVAGSGNTDTIKGSNQTYTLTGANAGGNGTVSWSGFEKIADSGTGSINTTGGRTYNLAGTNAGTVTSLLAGGFTGIGNLGDSTAGNFVFADGAKVTGTVSGGGAGTLDYSAYTTAVNVGLGGTATGTGGWSGISTAKGGSAADTISGSNQTYGLTGANAGGNGTVSWSSFENLQDSGSGTLSAANQTWTLTGHNQGSVTALGGSFSGVANLTDTGTGSFFMHSGADGDISGALDAGTNGSLDFTGYTTAVNVNLSGAGTTGVGGATAGVSSITANSNLGVSGAAGGALGITTTGVGTATTLGAVSVGSNLTIHASGAVKQGGALTVTGTTAIDAASNTITLDNVGNHFGDLVNLTGGTTVITDQSALTLGTLATGALSATSTGALDLGHGNVAGNLAATSNGGTITGGALTVSGSSNLQAANGAISLVNSGNRFAAAVTASGHGVSLVDSGTLTIASLNNGLDGKLSLTAGGFLLLPLSSIDTGTADLTLVANGGSFVTPGLLSGGNITLAGRDGLTLNSSLFTTGTAFLSSSNGAINQVGGVLYAATLTGSSSGDTTLTGANQLDTLGSFSAANFSLSNAKALGVTGPLTVLGNLSITTTTGALSVNGDLSADALTLFSADALDLSNNLTATTLSLQSGGNITQNSGVLTAATLTGSSSGDTTLSGSNQLVALGSFSAANFSLTNAKTLAVNGPLAVPGSLRLKTTAGALVANGNLSATSVSLNSAADLALAHNVNATTLALFSGGNISQSAGVLAAATLTGNSTGNTAFNGPNQLDTLSGFSAVNFSLTNAKTLAVNGPLTVPGSLSLKTTAGALVVSGALSANALTLNSATDLALAYNVNATTLTLTSAGNISQSGGVLTAGTLTGSSTGDATLNGVNQLDTLVSFNAANFNLTNAKTLSVNGSLMVPGSLSLTTTAGALAVSGDLSANSVTLNSATNLALARNVNASALALVSGGIISQSGGALTAGTLTGSSTGDTALDGANQFATLGSFSAPNFSLTNSQALSVNGPLSVPGSLSLTTTNGALTLNTDLSANTLTLDSANDFDLAHNLNTQTLALQSGGNLSQSGGVLTAATLTGSSTADTTLNGANQIGTLGSFSAANFALTNAQALAITGTLSAANIALNDSAGIVVSGAINATGTTTIGSGTSLRIGSGGAITGNVTYNGELAFDRNDAVNFVGAISGSGTLVQQGTGTLTLDGDSHAFIGESTVQNGTLVVGSVAGNGAVLGSDVTVDSGATLGGHGMIGGNVFVASGAHLAPGNSIGTLTIGGNLTVAQGGVLDFEFGAPASAPYTFTAFGLGDSVAVGGDLALNGATLNVSDTGAFGPGLYNLFTYGGTLTENNGGMTLGSASAGAPPRILKLTAQRQINLLNSAGLTLNLWNGNGLADATQMGGGDGTWSTTLPNWTDANGSVTAAMSPQPGFAIFGGAPGTVTVDGNGGASPVSASGLQFASNGYTLTGDTLTVVSSGGIAPVIRVGDGSAAGAGYSATISNVLTGSDGLTKVDLGTLVLTGSNAYSGSTTISTGTLQLGNGGTSGSIPGDVNDNGILVFDRSDALIFGGAVSGSGSLSQMGSGTTTLTGTHTYTGETVIYAGTLALSGGGSITDSRKLSADGVFDIAGTSAGTSIITLAGDGTVQLGTQTLSLTRAASSFGGTISGTGGLVVAGGLEGLDGDNTYTGGTTIDAGARLQIGTGATSGSIVGNVVSNGTLLFYRSDATSFDGVVSGSGSLSQIGDGTTTLAGTNTYTGGTTISAGTLQLGDGGTVGSIEGNVVNNAALAFDRGDAFTLGGVVSGDGSLSQIGTGTTTLTSNNTYTGGTTISAGTLQLGNGGTAGSIIGKVIDDGILAANRSNALTFDGVVSGSGALSQIGSGTTILTGNNTYAGGTTISAGILQIGNGGTTGSIIGSVTNNATFAFDRSDATTLAGVVSGSGSLSQLGRGTTILTGDSTYSGGTTISAGTLQLGKGGTTGSITGNVTDNGILAFDRSDAVTIGGMVSGSGSLSQMGSGTTILAGTNTYTGATDVAAGTLDIQGSLASRVSVNDGALLTGTGSIGGMTLASGATVSPGGNRVGTLTVSGDVSIAAGARYLVDAVDTGSSDQIHATGAASLGGASVISMVAGSNWDGARTYTILSADAGVSGTFGSVTSNFAFLDPTLSYDADHAYLTLGRNAVLFPSVGVTSNEIHTGAAIEALGAGNGVYDALLPLSAGAARGAFTELAGDSLASTRTALIDDSRYVRDAINNHLQGVQGAGLTNLRDVDGSVWVAAWGHDGHHDSDASAARLSSNGSGLLVGVDRDLGAWRVGAVAGTGQVSNNSTHVPDDANSTDTTLGLYTAADLGAWQLQGGAAHSWYKTSSHRRIGVVGLAGKAGAKYDNGVTQAYVDGGYRIQFDKFSLTPYANVDKVWLRQDAFREVGSLASLNVDADSSSVNFGSLGLRAVFGRADATQVHAQLGWQHAWGDLQPVNRQSFANGGGDSFTVAGLPAASNAGLFDLGVRFALSRRVSLDASYHGQFANNASDQGARMSLNVSF
ncbi:MAG: autotransporter-associated beta strand repeat-containing protein [Rhodanobacter sp.]